MAFFPMINNVSRSCSLIAVYSIQEYEPFKVKTLNTKQYWFISCVIIVHFRPITDRRKIGRWRNKWVDNKMIHQHVYSRMCLHTAYRVLYKTQNLIQINLRLRVPDSYSTYCVSEQLYINKAELYVRMGVATKNSGSSTSYLTSCNTNELSHFMQY